MPKKNKTRKQKMKAEQRKTTFVASSSVEKANKSNRVTSSIDEHVHTNTYPLPAIDTQAYIKHEEPAHTKIVLTKGYTSLTTDIRKTTIVTGAIVLVQLLVYFTM